MREAERRQSGRVLVLSTTAFTLLFAVWLMLGVLGVPIKQEMGLTTAQFTWLAAVAVLSGSLFRLPFGILTARHGGRLVMTALLLASAVPCYLVSRAQGLWDLALCAPLFGLSGNAFSIGVAWNAAWFPGERQGFALGTFGAGNVGASLTKLIGPTLIAVVPGVGFAGGLIPGGWRFVPVLYAVLLVAMAAAVWWLSPRPDRTPGAGRSLIASLRPLRQVRVWRFGLYYVVVFGAYVALSLWLPSYYRQVYGLGLGTAGLLTALFIFPASLLRPLGGWMSDRWGARPVTYGVFIGMTLVCLPLAIAPMLNVPLGATAFTVLVVLLGIGMGLGKASVYKYIPQYFPKDVGAVGGLVGTIGALGGFVLPLGFGGLEAATGRPESCFWVMLLLLVGSFSWLHLVVLDLRWRGRAPMFAGGVLQR